MRSRVLRTLSIAATALAVVITGSTSAFALQGGVTPNYARQSVSITGVGSDSIYEVMQDLDTLYNRSAGCAVGQTTGFDNWSNGCLDPGVYGNAAFAYGGSPITTENWYHDRVGEVFPVGSTAGAKTLNEFSKGTVGVNEVQRLTSTATGGTFTLRFGPTITTADIAYNASASAVQSALVALSNIDTGQVSASGGPLNSSPIDLTFQNNLGNSDVPTLVADNTNATGGSIVDSTTTPGVFTPIAADFARSSSGVQKTNCTNTTGGVTYTCYGVAFARDGLGVWFGTNNKAVQENSGGTAAVPRAYKDNLRLVWRGDGSGNCLDRFSNSATTTDDSFASQTTPYSTIAGWTSTDEAAHTNAAGNQDTVVPYAIQTSSGAGKDFSILALGDTSATDASDQQSCIPSVFKDNNPANGEHIIFENNATPICNQPSGTGASSGGAGTSDRAQAVYGYTYARFLQNGAGKSTAPCAGVLAKISPKAEGGGSFVAPSVKTIENLTASGYSISRQVYNYFQVPSTVSGSFDLNNPATWTLANGVSTKLQAVLYYLSPYGFLCQATHSTDPNTGTSYRTEIVAALHKDGFGQIASGSTTNGWTNVSFCRGNTT